MTLKECPFSGCATVCIVATDEEPENYYAQCDECDATGPLCANRNDAYKMWNRRDEA